MNISVIGTGYVGLVTGTCFAEMGYNVICVDIDETKIANLKNGIMPIYEPGLKEMVVRNYAEKRLSFTTDIQEASEKSNIHFIAVGTPPGADDAADLRFVLEVAKQLRRHVAQVGDQVEHLAPRFESVREGMSAGVRLEGSGEMVSGTVAWVGFEANPRNGKFPVEVHIANDDLPRINTTCIPIAHDRHLGSCFFLNFF